MLMRSNLQGAFLKPTQHNILGLNISSFVLNFSYVNSMATVLFTAHFHGDSPVGIIVGSAVGVIICLLIVIVMVTLFVRK